MNLISCTLRIFTAGAGDCSRVARWRGAGQVLTTSFAHFTAGLIFVFDNVASSKGLSQGWSWLAKKAAGRKAGTGGLQVGNVRGCILDGKGNVAEIKCTAKCRGRRRRWAPTTVSADRWSRCDYAFFCVTPPSSGKANNFRAFVLRGLISAMNLCGPQIIPARSFLFCEFCN